MGENKFPRAKEVKLSYADGNDTIEVKNFKGLVDEADVTKFFDVVGINYKVAQHDEVADIVTKSLTDLGIAHEQKPYVLNEGARLRIFIKFPDTKIGIGNDTLYMVSAFDNSYDCTTGLRYELGAYQSEHLIPLGGSYSKYYHRHTKGMSVNEIENTIYRGVETFQTKIKQELEVLVETKIDTLVLSGWLNDQINVDEGKKSLIPIKYLKKIKEVFTEERTSLNSLWDVYNMICRVLSKEDLHVDRYPVLCRTMLDAMKEFFRK